MRKVMCRLSQVIVYGLVTAGCIGGLAALAADPSPPLVGARQGTELWWSEELALKHGVRPDQIEVRLPDDSRVDWLTDEYATEIDWASKWPESVGQALYYSIWTGRKPAVLLLTKSPKDKLYVIRCQVVCAKHGIKLDVEPTYGDRPEEVEPPSSTTK